MSTTSLIPRVKEDIDRNLVEGILRIRYPSITVRGITILKEVHGTGAKLQLKVEHNAPNQVPDTMWLKTGLPASHFERMLAMGIYATEAKFYSDLQPLLNLRVPACFGAVYDAEGRGVVLLEDLERSGVKFPGYVAPMSVDEIASGLDLFSSLHGRSWQQEWVRTHEVGTFFAPGSAIEKNFLFSTVEYIENYLKGPVGEVVPAAARDAQKIHDAVWRLQPIYQQEPFSLLHGDAHPGNSYVTSAGDVGILDWQVYVAGPWAHDVSYWLVGGLSVDDRRRFERDLLKSYLSNLAQCGAVRVDPDEAWDHYRRFIAYGYWVWLRCPQSQQPIEHNIALSERFGAAMADHGVFELLGL